MRISHDSDLSQPPSPDLNSVWKPGSDLAVRTQQLPSHVEGKPQSARRPRAGKPGARMRVRQAAPGPV